MRVELVIDSADRLGECPLWDEREQALWWVDILAPAIKRFDGKLKVFPMPEPVGSIAFRPKGGLLAAMQTGIYFWERDKLRLFATPDGHDKTHRFNDGRCDRAGRFWVGTMKDPEHTPTGSLYRIEKDGRSARVRTQIKVPNSLAWSPDGRTMYFADSPRHKIWAYDYDTGAGEMRNERLPVERGVRRRARRALHAGGQGRPGDRSAGAEPDLLRIRRRAARHAVHHHRAGRRRVRI
jgi:sugar lactone lactonase YvrE